MKTLEQLYSIADRIIRLIAHKDGTMNIASHLEIQEGQEATLHDGTVILIDGIVKHWPAAGQWESKRPTVYKIEYSLIRAAVAK